MYENTYTCTHAYISLISLKSLCEKILIMTRCYLVLLLLFYFDAGACLNASNHSRVCYYNDSFQDINLNCSIVSIDFTVDSVALKKNIKLGNIKGFTLQGVNTTVQCLNDSGLTLTGVDNVTIAGMKFTGCGLSRRQAVETFGDVNIHYALLISWCKFVSLRHIVTTKSRGTGLALLNNHNVNIAWSNFTDNSLQPSDFSSFAGGNGIYFELSCCQGCNTSRDKAYSHSNSSLYIDHCIFAGNHAASSYNLTSITGLGNGGGMEIWIHRSSSNSLTIRHSQFMNNSATWGGGMQIVFSAGSQNNHVILEHSKMESNSALSNGGGGLDLGYIRENVVNNHILLSNVSFKWNHALFGGAMAIFTYNALQQENNSVFWTHCIWFENRAHYAAAINVSPQMKFSGNRELILHLANCTFQSNVALPEPLEEYVQRNGKGIVMITGRTMIFTGSIKFLSNNSTGIHAISSTLLFNRSDALFKENTARSGAGISLIGNSVILVSESTSLTFCNNSVSRYGSAIYYFSIDKSAYVHPRACFIQKLNPSQKAYNVFLNFLGNTAQNKIDAIYGTSLKTCSSYSPESKEYEFESVGTFRVCETCKIGIENTNYSCLNERTAIPVKTIEGDVSVNMQNDVFKFVPGKTFALPVSMELRGKRANALYSVTITNDENSNITIANSFFVTKGNLTLHAKPGDRATVTFTEIFFRKVSVTIPVEAQDCPPLYKMEKKVCVCISAEDVHFVEFHHCFDRDFQASIRLGYWINYIRKKENTTAASLGDRYLLLNSFCPLGYCYKEKTEEYHRLPSHNITEFNEAVCNNSSRHGTLCGLCKKNTAVYFHSETFRCGSTDLCYLGPLFYLLSEILPLTLLFVFIIVFNISFTSGYLNGFIFFSQIYDNISELGSSFIPHVFNFSNRAHSFNHLFFRLFNIDFFAIEELSFCLFNTQKTLNILLIKFLTVAYGFFLVLSVIWLIRCCSKFKCLRLRISRYSVIQGLAAFLVMVYSQCTYVSFSLLNMIHIYKGTKRYTRVVFLQGNIEYFSSEHLPYAIPALLCLLFLVAPLPLLLIVYPLCNRVIAYLKLENNRIVILTSRSIPVTRIKPLLDCFQGTFKDNFRFFAGLYFAYRVSIILSRFASGVFLTYTIIEIQVVLMLVVHALAWPYQKRIHNVIDLFMFTNLAIINSLKLLNFIFTENGAQSRSEIRKIEVIQTILIYIPIATLLLTIIIKLGKKLMRILLKVSGKLKESAIVKEPCEDPENDFLEDDRHHFASESYRMMKRENLEELRNVIG